MLEVDKISVSYGEVPVLWDVSLKVGEKEMVVLIGPNGHGKSTILKTISGVLNPSTGSISFRGKEISKIPSHEVIRLGIVHVPEGGRLFPEMTVKENLLMGAYAIEAWKSRAENLKVVFGLFPSLEERRNQMTWTLSGGERQMLGLGRGLMSSAKLLMIDEPSMGLAPYLVLEVYEKIREIKKMGVSLLLADQNIEHVSKLADRGYLIENGRVALEGNSREILNSKHLKEAYLGV